MRKESEQEEKRSRKAREKLRETRRRTKKTVLEGKKAIIAGKATVREIYNELEGVKKLAASLIVILGAELLVQKLLWFLTTYTDYAASVILRFTLRIEGLRPTDQIALLILGSLITTTLLVSLQLRAIDYSLTRANVQMQKLHVALEGVPSNENTKATDGGQPVEKKSEPDDSRREGDTSRIGAVGGALAGGTYGAIFGVAGIVAGVAIGAMFGDEIEKRILDQKPEDRESPVEEGRDDSE